MAISLEELIAEHQQSLVDEIVKDAIRQLPSYATAPLRLTVERAERWLQAVSDSIGQNDPDILEQYLVVVAGERMAEGYVVGEVHGIIRITEQHVRALILRSTTDEIERNGLLALLNAVMGAARMVLSVRYVLSRGGQMGAQVRPRDGKS